MQAARTVGELLRFSVSLWRVGSLTLDEVRRLSEAAPARSPAFDSLGRDGAPVILANRRLYAVTHLSARDICSKVLDLARALGLGTVTRVQYIGDGAACVAGIDGYVLGHLLLRNTSATIDCFRLFLHNPLMLF